MAKLEVDVNTAILSLGISLIGGNNDDYDYAYELFSDYLIGKRRSEEYEFSWREGSSFIMNYLEQSDDSDFDYVIMTLTPFQQ